MADDRITFEPASEEDWDYILDLMVSTYYETARWPMLLARPEAEVRQEMRFYVEHEQATSPLDVYIKEKRARSEALIAWDKDRVRAGCVLYRILSEAGSKTAWIYLFTWSQGVEGRAWGKRYCYGRRSVLES